MHFYKIYIYIYEISILLFEVFKCNGVTIYIGQVIKYTFEECGQKATFKVRNRAKHIWETKSDKFN